MSSKSADERRTQLESLLQDYPELKTGLESLTTDEDGDETVALVGAFTLIQLRLRAVLRLLPHAKSDE